MLLLLDEMGKPLEYAAAHPDTTDLFLLQELAEYANRSRQTPFLVMGILHQAFERYAVTLDGATQREWAKVQGRFEDIAFQEPPDQQMRLLVNTLEHVNGSLASSGLSSDIDTAVATGWLPPLMQPDEFIRLCREAQPFHPTSLVALPYLFRRLAQNERSIFAYLASQEPFGFQEFLHSRSAQETIRLSDLFDYLVANFQGRLYASLRARPLTETLERVNNGHSLSPLTTDLMKTIGLLNWLGEVSPFQATESRVFSAVRSPEYSDDAIRKALQSLQTRSYIVHRRFNATYSVWQGSDVDIEQRLEEARQRLSGSFSLAETVQRYLPPRPVVASRHSYQTGAMRYFEVRYVDQALFDQTSLQPDSAASGLVLICLPAGHAEAESFAHWAVESNQCQRSDIVVCVVERTVRLAELVSELRSLQWVREYTPDLRDDPVARRELRTRAAMIENLIRVELDVLLAPGQLSRRTANTWFHKGVKLSGMDSLSQFLSLLCDELYPGTPRLWNELINRRTLSSQGAGARRNLIEAMLTKADQERLGIKGYPPERSMYESVLRKGGLHRQGTDDLWALYAPPADDPLGLQPSWQAIYDFVFAASPEPGSVQALFDLLSATPYGLTAGVAPLFLCAFMALYRDETTLYREGTLLPEPGIADWEVLLRRPELFAVAGCRVTGLRAAVVERMAHSLRVAPYVMPVVRAVIGGLKALPEHAWRTRRLPASALALRQAVDMARSPEHFLFVEVPQALDLPAFEEGEFEQERFDLFFERLNVALDALANATHRLLAWARDQWLAACGLPSGEQGWDLFRQTTELLAPRTTDPVLVPLLKRTVEAADNRSALESVLALLSNRPLRTWTDGDAERFAGQARYVGELWRQISRNLSDLSRLSPEGRQHAESIAEELQRSLQKQREHPEIVRAAVLLLLDRLQDQTIDLNPRVVQ